MRKKNITKFRLNNYCVCLVPVLFVSSHYHPPSRSDKSEEKNNFNNLVTSPFKGTLSGSTKFNKIQVRFENLLDSTKSAEQVHNEERKKLKS